MLRGSAGGATAGSRLQAKPGRAIIEFDLNMNLACIEIINGLRGCCKSRYVTYVSSSRSKCMANGVDVIFKVTAGFAEARRSVHDDASPEVLASHSPEQ
jgi:hypothetical protein